MVAPQMKKSVFEDIMRPSWASNQQSTVARNLVTIGLRIIEPGTEHVHGPAFC
uniref:Uncharacterized protein n=1 Tax=Triticum urartu TaxID=4572 RepID=A0A8R7PE52_TRIUA